MTTQTVEQREQELRDAVAFSEQVAAGKAQLPIETNTDEYWRSVDDIKGKLATIEEARHRQAQFGKSFPEETQQMMEEAEAIIASPSADYVSPKAQALIDKIQARKQEKDTIRQWQLGLSPTPKPPEPPKPSEKAQQLIDIIHYRGATKRGEAPTVQVGVKTESPELILDTPEIKALQRNDPKLYQVLKGQGVEAYNNAVTAEQYATKAEIARFERINTQLPDGQWVSKADLAKTKRDSPEVYLLLTTQGLNAANKYVEDYNAKAAIHNAQVEKQNLAISKLEPFTKGDKVDVLAFIRANRDTASQTLQDAGYEEKDIKQWQKDTISPLYLNAIYQETLKEKRNELLKTEKPQPLEDATAFYSRVDSLARAEAYKGFTKAEQAQLTKEQLISLEGFLIPGVETAAHWSYLSTPEKVFAVTTDVVMVATILWGGKILTGAARKLGLTSIAKVEKLAVKAGKAGKDLEKATAQALKNAGKTGTIAETKQFILNNTVETAQRASMKADTAFLNKLETLDRISPKDLKLLEKQSGIKGLSQSIRDVSTASKDVKVAWKYADKSKFYTAPKNAAQLEANNRHLFRLAELQDAKVRLDLALERAGSTLKPRYSQQIAEPRISPLYERFGPYQTKRVTMKTPLTKDEIALLGFREELGGTRKSLAELKNTLSPEEYKRLQAYLKTRTKIPQAKLNKAKLKKLKLNADEETLKRLDEWLSSPGGKDSPRYKRLEDLAKKSRERYETAQQQARAQARVTLAEQAKELPELLAKRVPLPKGKPKPTLKPSELPKVKPAPTSAFPGIKVKPKEVVTAKTEKQRAAQYSTEELADVRSQTISEALSKTRGFERLTPKEWQQVNELIKEGVKAGTETQTKVITKGLTSTQARDAVKEAVKQKINEIAQTKPVPITKPQVDIVIKTIVDTPTPTKPIEPIKPLKPFKPKLKPPLKLTLPSGGKEEEEWTPEEIKSAIAWKDGFVVHALKSPYRRGIDERTYHISNVPPGLKVMNIRGKGSQQATIRSTGITPARITVDVGNQDAIITRSGGRVSIRHRRDTRGTVSMATISKKRGRIYHTNIGGSEVLSRHPLRGF